MPASEYLQSRCNTQRHFLPASSNIPCFTPSILVPGIPAPFSLIETPPRDPWSTASLHDLEIGRLQPQNTSEGIADVDTNDSLPEHPHLPIDIIRKLGSTIFYLRCVFCDSPVPKVTQQSQQLNFGDHASLAERKLLQELFDYADILLGEVINHSLSTTIVIFA